MRNAEYWRRRFEALEESRHKAASSAMDGIGREFNLAQRAIEDRILAWYGRFAENNQISLAEARKLLASKELAELKWDVGEYIQRGKENAADGRWMKELENASARAHVSRLEALKLETREVAEGLYAKIGGDVRGLLERTYADGYSHAAYEVQKGLGVGHPFAGPDARRIEGLMSQPWTADGDTFSDRLWKQKERLIDELHTQLAQGMIVGRTPDESIKAIAREFGASKANAGRVVMTESAFIAGMADRDAYKELGVEEYEILGTLDSKTCALCGSMDGRVFKSGEHQAGVSAPPYHPWCRCTTVPHFADDDAGADGRERAARGEDGYYTVPADMGYAEWKSIYVDKTKPPRTVAAPAPPPTPGVASGATFPATAGQTGGGSATISMGTLEKAFSQAYTDEIKTRLDNAPKDIKKAWNKYVDRLGVTSTNYSGTAHYSFSSKGINVDMAKASVDRSRDFGNGQEIYKKAYGTVFHEFGHNISALYSADNGRVPWEGIDRIFESKTQFYKVKALDANGAFLKDASGKQVFINKGYTLTKLLEEEGEAYVKKIWDGMKADAKAKGLKAVGVKKADAYQKIVDELLSKSVLAHGDVSDMWQGITNEKVVGHIGHKKGYWKTHSVGSEGFAEMFDATISNPDSITQIKHYFPKSYDLFNEIIAELGA